MSHCDLPLLINVSQEGPLVVDAEVEDAVLVGRGEGGLVDCRVLRCADRVERDAVEGREHAEFELEGVGGGDGEGDVVVEGVFGELDLECLWPSCQWGAIE